RARARRRKERPAHRGRAGRRGRCAMRFTWARAMTIARRGNLFTFTRKAFLFTVVGIPVFYALLMFIMIKPQVDNALKTMKDFHALGLVDSTGLFASAPPEIRTEGPPT